MCFPATHDAIDYSCSFPSFGLPLTASIHDCRSLVCCPIPHPYRSCDQLQNRGLHVNLPIGFDGRRHRSSDSVDKLIFFCNSERLMSNFCSADALADGHKNANDFSSLMAYYLPQLLDRA